MKIHNHGNGIISAVPDDTQDHANATVSHVNSDRVVANAGVHDAGGKRLFLNKGCFVFHKDKYK